MPPTPPTVVPCPPPPSRPLLRCALSFARLRRSRSLARNFSRHPPGAFSLGDTVLPLPLIACEARSYIETSGVETRGAGGGPPACDPEHLQRARPRRDA